MNEEDSLTFYEELSEEKASLDPQKALSLWPMIVVMCISWCILLGVSAVVECKRDMTSFCIFSSESTQWGSVVYAGNIMSILALGLHYKNYQRSKSQLALSFVCYFFALIDVLIVRDLANEAMGVLTTGSLLLWMGMASYSTKMAIHSRPLTRGKRWRIPLALILCTILFGLNFIALCVLRFRFKGQTSGGELIVFLIGAAVLLLYVLICTVYIKKIKFIVFNKQ